MYSKRNLSLTIILSMLILSMGCTNMFFFPMKEHVLSPEKIGLSYEDVYIETADNIKLHGWFLHAQKESNETAKTTVVLLHGNAENISTHIGAVYWLPKEGFNVFLYDYRGYGKSEGELSIESAISDVAKVINHLTKRDDVDKSKLIIFGQSLGAAIAANAVAKYQTKYNISALVLESGFSDFRKIAKEKLNESWLTWALQWPLSLTITNNYSPAKALSHISDLPILIIHGDNDKVIPLKHGKRLYDSASQPKDIWIVPDGLHTNTTTKTNYRIKLINYFNNVVMKNKP